MPRDLTSSVFIFVDTETTSISSEEGQILTLSYRVVDLDRNLIEQDTINVKFRRDHFPDPKTIKINKINPFAHAGINDRAASRQLTAMLNRVYEKNSQVYLVGHNINFDRKFIRSMLHRGGFGKSRLPVMIDTMEMAARASSRGYLKADGAEGDAASKASLGLENIAKLTGKSINQDKLHSSSYDTEIGEHVFFELHNLLKDDVKSYVKIRTEDFQNKYAQKTVNITYYDLRQAEFKTKKLFVVGQGTGPVSSSYGEHRFFGTIALDIDRLSPTFNDNPDDGSIISGVVEVDFRYHAPVVSVEEIETPSVIKNMADKISSLATFTTKENRLVKIEKEANDIASTYGFAKNNTRPSDFIGIFPLEFPEEADAVLVHQLKKIESKSEGIELLLKSYPGQGAIWYEIYFERMAFDIFQQEGVEMWPFVEKKLKSMLPEAAVPVEKIINVESEISSKTSKAILQKRDITELKLVCDGQNISIMAMVKQKWSELDSVPIVPEKIGGGRISYPQAEAIGSRLVAVLGVNKTTANEIRTGFKTFIDNVSFIAYRKYLSEAAQEAEANRDFKAKNALLGALGYMSKDYETVLKDLNRDSTLASEPLVVPNVNEAENLSKEFKKISAVINENRSEHTVLFNHILKLDSDPRRLLDAAVLKIGPNKYIKACDGSANIEGSDDIDSIDRVSDSSESNASVDGVGTRCKICNIKINSQNAVGGMGRKCAKKLSEWLSSEATINNSIFDSVKKNISEYVETDGKFPIMIIKEKSTGNIFASDVIKKLPDGRLMAIDLTAVNERKTGTSSKKIAGDHIRDIMHVFLDEENYEVKSVFNSKKK